MKISELLESINEEEIHRICAKYGIENYSINPDGSVDVRGNVDLSGKKLTKIPLRFNHVTGFSCNNNPELKSLEGSPRIADENFYCSLTGIKSLIGGPKEVKKRYYCSSNQNLKSLEGLPEKISGKLWCSNNPNLIPWETRYVMFCEGLEDVFFGNELDQVYKEYFQTNKNERGLLIPDILDKLQEMS